jgi:uncharacterized YigZ family protein
MDDRYYTIRAPSQAETRVKGSRFLAESKPVISVKDVQVALERIRKREYAATHHCYAYRVGLFDRMTFKYSDDGEPSGTAGCPIYDVICGCNLTNVLIVVTRYFGGTKLGTGGLARAYSEAAKLVVKKSGTKENFITESIKVEVEFPFYNQLVKILPEYSAKQTKADYSDRVALELEVRQSRADALIAEITQLSGGKARIERKKGVPNPS